MDLCSRMYVLATLEYSKKCLSKNSGVSQVHFLDIKPETVKEIQDKFSEALEKGRSVDPDYSRYLPSGRSGTTSQYRSSPGTTSFYLPKDNLALKDLNLNLPLEKTDDLFYSVKGHRVKIFAQNGNIADTNTDSVIVVLDGTGQGGRLAKAVQAKMDTYLLKEYNQELQFKFKSSMRTGKVISTGGCGSHFQQIFHAVLPYNVRNNSDRMNILSNVYCKVFKELRSTQSVSVATALLGISK